MITLPELLLVTGRLLLAYLLVFKVVPALTERCFAWWNPEIIPTSAGKYRISTLTGKLILYTVIILIFSKYETSPLVFYTEQSVPIGLLGAAFMVLFLSLFMLFLPGKGKEQAKALGLQTPRDIAIHSTWYAFVWAAFREELFFRGLVQTQTTSLLGVSWGLLAPLLFFSANHAYNSANPRVTAVWVLSTLPGSLIFTMSYHLSSSLTAPVIAHGMNNALAGLMVYLALYREKQHKPAALFAGTIASVYLAVMWGDLLSLLEGISFNIKDDLLQGILMVALLLTGASLINKIGELRKNGRGTEAKNESEGRGY